MIDYSGLIADRTKDFTGREWAFAEIDRWLADSDGPPFFIITGEPGIGKTAIAARLTQVRDLAAYHFCIARRADTIDPLNFARSLSHQLTHIDGFALDILGEKGIHIEVHINILENYGEVIGLQIKNLLIEAPSAAIAFNRTVLDPLQRLYSNGFDRQLVILVDALDEAVQQPGPENIVDLLANARGFPSQVRFVLTSRREDAALRHFEHLRMLPLLLDAGHEENLDDVRQYVRRQVDASEALQARLSEGDMRRETFLERATEVSQGNFLYLVWLLPAIAVGTQRFDTLEALPQGLDGIYREFLRTRKVEDEAAWRQCYRPLLGVLAAAQAPLTLDQVAQFTGLDRQAVNDGLRDVGQFLEPSGAAQDRYQLYHQSVIDWLGSREQAQEFWIDLAPMHQHIVSHYRAGAPTWDAVDWGQADDYGLRYLPVHLAVAGKAQDLYVLISKPWLEAKLTLFGVHIPFLQDIDLALAVARQERPANLAQIVRCCALYSRFVTYFPHVVIDVLARTGQVTRARRIADKIVWPVDRCLAFASLAETLNVSNESEKAKKCLQEARRSLPSVDPIHRGMALSWIVKAALAIDDCELAYQASHEALTLALNLSALTEWDQPNTLFWAAKALRQVKDQEGLAQVRQALRGWESMPIRNLFLQTLSVAQDEAGLERVFELFTAPSWLSDPMSMRNLSNLALAVADAGMRTERDQILALIDQALHKNLYTGPPDAYRRFVWALALAGQFGKALDHVEQIGDLEERVKALSIVGELAIDKQQGAATERVLALAKAMAATDDWRVLSRLASIFLRTGDAQTAIEVAERVCSASNRGTLDRSLTMRKEPREAPSGFKLDRQPLRTEIGPLDDERLAGETVAYAESGEWPETEAKLKEIQVPAYRAQALMGMVQYAVTQDRRLQLWIEAMQEARLAGRDRVDQVLQAGEQIVSETLGSDAWQEIQRVVSGLADWWQ